jgi:peptidoglycan/LPS O-acetylase OafA/YrhL
VWLAAAALLRWNDAFSWDGRTSILLMLRFGHLFIAGMMLYRAHMDRAIPLTWVVLTLSAAFSLFGRDDWANIGSAPYFTATVAFIVVVGLAASQRLPILSSRSAIALGAMSYPLYLLHQTIGEMLGFAAKALQLPVWSAYMFAIPMSLMLAGVAHRYIEKPAQRWIRNPSLRLRDAYAPHRPTADERWG